MEDAHLGEKPIENPTVKRSLTVRSADPCVHCGRRSSSPEDPIWSVFAYYFVSNRTNTVVLRDAWDRVSGRLTSFAAQHALDEAVGMPIPAFAHFRWDPITIEEFDEKDDGK